MKIFFFSISLPGKTFGGISLDVKFKQQFNCGKSKLFNLSPKRSVLHIFLLGFLNLLNSHVFSALTEEEVNAAKKIEKLAR